MTTQHRFDALLKMLSEKSTRLLINERGLSGELRRLLHENQQGRLGQRDTRRLLNMLRVTELDLKQAMPVRWVAGILLITVELKIGGRGHSKSPAETQLQQG